MGANDPQGVANLDPRGIQSNLNGSNTDGSFTMAHSNSFLNPYGINPIVPENNIYGNFHIFS